MIMGKLHPSIRISSCLIYCLVVLLFLQLGGAMAPTIKELSRWLDANSEYFVTPEWATVVKHSVSMTLPAPQ